MTERVSAGAISREKIVEDLVLMITDITRDWDTELGGGITERTGLVADLGFQSIDVVMLVGEIHKHYHRRNLPFERVLLSGGRYAEEIRISDLADFLHAELNGGAPSGAPAVGA